MTNVRPMGAMTKRGVKIGVHLLPEHHRREDMQMLAQLPAPVCKVVYSSTPNLEHVGRVVESAPGLIVLRDHPLSEQHDDVWRDPVGTGRRHAQEWHEHLPGIPRDRIVVEGVNEFPIWEPGGMEAQLAYELAFGEEGLRLGLPTIHGEAAVGWPGNNGDDTPPDWTPWLPLLRWIDAHPGRYLGLHEYWGFNKGVHFYAGWWFLRYRKMPIKVPTILTELGGLKAHRNEDGSWGLRARDGWKGDIEADAYFAQWREAEAELQRDSYLAGATLFTTDGAHPWIEECDAAPVNPLWLAYAQSAASAAPEMPHTVYIPVVTVGEPEQPQPPDAPAPGRPEPVFNPLVAEAIMTVESGGEGFDAYGRLKVRVEAHLLLDARYGNPAAFAGRFRFNPQNYLQAWFLSRTTGQWVEYHAAGQAGEWAALETAMEIDRAAALRCTSMGASQVMGFNHGKIGYPTVEAMFRAFGRSVAVHVLGFVNYCLATPGLPEAIAACDWPAIGRLYNGAASAGELYRAAHERLVE